MDDEELEQGGQGSANQTGGRFNPATKVANGAKNVENTAKGVSKLAEQSSKKATEKAAQQTGKKATKSAAKSASRKKMSQTAAKVATKAGKVAKVAAKLAKIMSTVGIIIIILIAIIGILVFIITGFGFIIQGLKNIAASFWTAIDTWFEGGENAEMSEQDIVDVASYLEEMDYDLFGYGFVTKDNAITSAEDNAEKELRKELGDKKYEDLVKKADEGDEEAQKTINDKKGSTKASLNGGKDAEAFKYLKAYLVSDNYAYFTKNENTNLRTMTGNGVGRIL